MPSRPPTHRPLGANVRPAAPPRASASARGYGRPWQALRLSHLALHPLCRTCSDAGRIVEATEVDHAIPHGGDRRLLMDRSNLVSLCKPCHSRKTVAEDGGLGNAPVARCEAIGAAPAEPELGGDRPADAACDVRPGATSTLGGGCSKSGASPG